jgi:hypothetical protein
MPCGALPKHDIKVAIPHQPGYFCAYPEGSPTGAARLSGSSTVALTSSSLRLVYKSFDLYRLVVRVRDTFSEKRAPWVPFFHFHLAYG